MMRSNLFLNRLIIYTVTGKVAYDEAYHRGINIICGDNSSGKSTITHFIFYVLGGSFNDWVREAKRCSMVLAEVEMNGAVLVIKREININPQTNKGNPMEPIYVYWGDFESSQKSASTDWQKFGYVTTDSRKSFSNVFFENLDIPIVRGDNNITFHQILRLLYVDQDSPTNSLFLYEQFDTTLNRETVSDLLLGVYNQDLYDSKQRLVEASNELDDVKKEIKIIRQFIPKDHDLIPENLKTRIENKEAEISEIEEQLLELNQQNKAVRFTKQTKLEFEKLNEEAIEQRSLVKKLETDIRALRYEIEDSAFFIKTLETKSRSVKNSILARDFLGEFPLAYCPECLSEIKKTDDDTKCKLCKEVIDSSFGVTQARKIEQELSFQIKESKALLITRNRQLDEMKGLYESEKVKLYNLQARVNAALKDVKSVRDEKIDALYIEKGFAEGAIIQLRTLLENAELYQSLVEKREGLEKEIKTLGNSIDRMTTAQFTMKEQVNKVIEKKALYLLNNDLKRQEDFMEAKEFNIDYRNNLAFISDKEAKYSASSNFYLKTTARFAIFLASLEVERMRYPRFILCDNMEDKGIEEKRAQNFQKIIIEETEKHDSEHYQMIYTTSFITEELKNSTYRVGEYYTKESPSLQNVY
ncbi:AAA family ATPase [Chitinophaga agrisoli]|uniref:AAA family ATPase n=1 Tax=Chitinophaga agrisoli TaxID=2607653 RepID=A0A5B2VTA1_9BACT|nr:ATP-binding protein [Chitinophaga agrisoli]KAA2241516.1 AAA family ATPase [Chitinophaga agrisoli]